MSKEERARDSVYESEGDVIIACCDCLCVRVGEKQSERECVSVTKREYTLTLTLSVVVACVRVCVRGYMLVSVCHPTLSGNSILRIHTFTYAFMCVYPHTYISMPHDTTRAVHICTSCVT